MVILVNEDDHQIGLMEKIEAHKKGIEISDQNAREHVYGMPYPEWKKKYQK